MLILKIILINFKLNNIFNFKIYKSILFFYKIAILLNSKRYKWSEKKLMKIAFSKTHTITFLVLAHCIKEIHKNCLPVFKSAITKNIVKFKTKNIFYISNK